MYKEIMVDGKRVMTDGKKNYTIHEHKEYGEYIYVDNKLNTDDTAPFNELFTGRLKDAIDTVRNGGGDCIEMGHMFGTIIDVVYFLDRNVGEELRKKTIEGLKDAKFKWIITCGNKNSMSGYYPLSEKYETFMPALSRDEKPLLFDTREEAVKCVEDLLDKARQYASKFVAKAEGVTDSEENYLIFKEMIEDIRKEYSARHHSIVARFATDMLDTKNMVFKNEKRGLVDWGYDIEQYCINL